MNKFEASLVAICLALSGCAHVPSSTTAEASASTGIDGVPCVGSIEAPAPQLADFRNPALLAQSQRATNQGYLCSAKSLAVMHAIRLYRLIDSSQPYSKLGSFWAFDRPTGTRDDYRAKFAICKQWSELDRLISCDVRPGTVIVVGTTQSADCGQGMVYAKTAANQVFVANDGLAGIVHVGACTDEGAWPPGVN